MITLSTALTRYMLEDRAPATQDVYRRVLNRAVGFLGAERGVSLISKEDILLYIQSLRAQDILYANHPRRAAEKGQLSEKTVEKHVKTLITFFRWLVENDLLEKNPCDRVHLRRFKREPGSSKAATPDELQKMLRVAEAKAALGRPLHLAVFIFLCDTGARCGEAASVTVGDLMLDQGYSWCIGKGNKERPLFYGDRTAAILRLWLAHHPDPIPSASLFGLAGDSISQVINRLAKSAGISRPLGAHAIRHRVGQVWSSAKMSEQATQLKLGHDSPTITMEMYYNTTYDHVAHASRTLSLAAIYGVPNEPMHITPRSVLLYRKTGS